VAFILIDDITWTDSGNTFTFYMVYTDDPDQITALRKQLQTHKSDATNAPAIWLFGELLREVV
jgi:hypothetical protein